MNKIISLIALLLLAISPLKALTPIDSLASRVTEGTSEGRIEFKLLPSNDDFFEISSDSSRVVITGNNYVSMAVGLNWYLKYVAGIHISWNQLTAPLPEQLPLPTSTIRQKASVDRRYYLNYCTFSYSMPFWDEDRWMKEIDWMALHGINMPLSITGIETVWRNLLRSYGYSDDEIGRFIAGPAYMAWWQMNNLEGWGGPLPGQWYDDQEALQKKIVERMRLLGITPVFPGFAGMVPSDSGEKLGLDIADPGLWCGFRRPAFLSPSDPKFDKLADDYYAELTKLYGTSEYYSMDPFHEGGNSKGVNLAEAATKIMSAMKRANPDAKWVIQSWNENPRKPLIDTLDRGELVVLDLYSETNPKWNRGNGYAGHDWVYCNLLNFGGNIGLHGRMDSLIDGFYAAQTDSVRGGNLLTGVGATPEGIENNPVMYELTFELPWRSEPFTSAEWLSEYLEARYGRKPTPEIVQAWEALRHTVYNAPLDYPGQGTVESLMCARPDWNPESASTWGRSLLFYSPDSTAKAAKLMAEAPSEFHANPNFSYDLADISRQANTDRANRLLSEINAAHTHDDTDSVTLLSEQFLALILEQDSILAAHPGMNVASWLDSAQRKAHGDPEAEELYRRNAAQLVTVWGDETAANRGGLHDYSHREWSGLLRELYYRRWKAFFDHQLNNAPEPDYYKIETEWVDTASQPK